VFCEQPTSHSSEQGQPTVVLGQVKDWHG
jgi:hypothetical protein